MFNQISEYCGLAMLTHKINCHRWGTGICGKYEPRTRMFELKHCPKLTSAISLLRFWFLKTHIPLWLFFFFFWLHWVLVAARRLLSCGMRTLSCSMHVGSSSLIRDRTRAPCIGSAESYPLHHQGSPPLRHFWLVRWTKIIKKQNNTIVGNVACEFLAAKIKTELQGFPGGAVVENLPANAEDTGSSPGLGRSYMPRSN